MLSLQSKRDLPQDRLELGGNGPASVLADADPDAITQGRFNSLFLRRGRVAFAFSGSTSTKYSFGADRTLWSPPLLVLQNCRQVVLEGENHMRVPIDQIGKSTELKWKTTSDIKSEERKPVTTGRFDQIFCGVVISLIFAIVALLASLIAAL